MPEYDTNEIAPGLQQLAADKLGPNSNSLIPAK